MPGQRTARLAFVLQDVNSWAGQERVTLELVRRLSHRHAVDVYAFTLEDPQGLETWGDVTFHPVRPRLRGPAGARTLLFAAAVEPSLRAARRRGALVHAAGACAMTSDVVLMHYVHSAWNRVKERLSVDMRRASRSARAAPGRAGMMDLYQETLSRLYMAMERRAFTPSKVYVACSRKVALELEEHFGLREQVHVIHHGVDPGVFRPPTDEDREERAARRRSVGAGPDDVLALFVGAYDRKGLPAAIQAMGCLESSSRRRARLAAVGDGNRQRYQDLASRAGCLDRISFLPHTRDIVPLYQAADLFLFPTHYEPFGLVILEAMACGLAPIVSREAGASELIEHGRDGLLLENPADPEEIAAAWSAMLDDETKRLRMGENARRRALERSWDHVAGEHDRLLAPLLAARSA